ncbi:MAG TPA: acyl-CoA dehydrogenase family protein [Allosphingosinicella sp.]|nr:acyl-CoA dehydrogenase family protein [Allosphingosinicella sp.]
MKNEAILNECPDIAATMVTRAAALEPMLRQRVPATQIERRLSADTMRDIREAGLMRASVPEAFGGVELPPSYYWRVSAALAKGCPATAWVYNVFSVHNQVASLFPEKGQAEIFGADPDVGVCGVLTERSTAREVEGGVMLRRGLWPFASGCHHSGWAILGASVEGRPKPLDMAFLAVPMDELEIVDDWYVSGLRGTGSNSVRPMQDELFVPSHRVIDAGLALAHKHGDSRPRRMRLPFAPAASLMLGAGVGIGTAETALEYYQDFVVERSKRALSYSNAAVKKKNLPSTRRAIAEATARIAAARGLADQVADTLWEIAGDPSFIPDNKIRSRMRLLTVHLMHECKNTVAMLFQETGASALQENNRIGRLLRDAQGMVMHESFDLGQIQDVFGRVALGDATDHWAI